MAAPTSPHPEDRGPSKRQKGDEIGGPGDESGAPPYPPRGPPNPQQRYQSPPGYGAPMPQQAGYGMWGSQAYPPAGPPPAHPHAWGQQGPPPPHPGGPGMYPQRGPPPGDRPPEWTYGRGHPPSGGPPPPPPVSGHGRSQIPPPSGPNGKKDAMDDDMKGLRGAPPQHYSGWSPHHGQWGQPPPPSHPPYGPPPPGAWQGASGPPSMHSPPMYPGWSKSPPRSRPRPDVMPGYPRAEMDMSYMSSRSVGPPHDDDCASSSAGGSVNKGEKGRGSYKCGRCGVPKKGHVCPYQPKLKRRPDEPPPEMRNAAVQVEMDEFLTLRRLNIKIQGLPESYASEPYLGETMVIGEPHPLTSHLPPESLSAPSMLLDHPSPEPLGHPDALGGGRDPPPLTSSPSSSPLPPHTRGDNEGHVGEDDDDDDDMPIDPHHHTSVPKTTCDMGIGDNPVEEHGTECVKEAQTV